MEENNKLKGYGTSIKKLLLARGMTIKELAEISGVSVYTLYTITKNDNKRLNSETLLKISSALGIEPYELAPDYINREMDFATFGWYLKDSMREKGFTQKMLADEIGCARSTISMYTSNQGLPPAEILEKLTKILKLNPDIVESCVKRRYTDLSPKIIERYGQAGLYLCENLSYLNAEGKRKLKERMEELLTLYPSEVENESSF